MAKGKGLWEDALKRWRSGGTRFAVFSVLCHLLNGVSGVLVIRWLEPLALGWWNASQMIRLPLEALRTGILSGMNREYPFLIGNSEPVKARQVLETGLAHTLAIVVISQIVVGAVLCSSTRDQSFLVAGLLANSFVWSVGCYSQFVRSTLRTSNNFRTISQLELAVAVVDSVAVLLVWRYGYYGLLARAMASAGLIAAAFYHFRPVNVRPRLHLEALARMFRFGRHTYVTGYLLLIGSNAERLILLTINDGVKLLGLYTPAIICASFLQVIPSAVHNYYYPQLVEAYGRDGDEAKLLSSIVMRIKRAALMMVGVSAVAAGGLSLLIKFFLPAYEGSLVPTMLVCLVGPFFPLRMCASYYASLHRWPEYYAFAALQTALPFLAIWALLPFFAPLTAVALGYVISVAGAGGALLSLTFAHAAKMKAQPSYGV